MTDTDTQRAEYQRAIRPGLREASAAEAPPPALDKPVPERELAGPLTWLVDRVAGIRVSVYAKLLAGFLLGALLLLGMGVLSLGIIGRMSGRVAEMRPLFQQVDLARQMEYEVPAQSHFRGMALLTQDDENNAKIAASKRRFVEKLARVEAEAGAEQSAFFGRVREANDRFAASSAKALDLYRAGNMPESLLVHLEEEHPISHELEAAMRELVVLTTQNMERGVAAIQADQTLVSRVVVAFAIVSVSLALLLGLLLSWSFIRPIRKMGQAMYRIAVGDFSQPLYVRNRDELGDLANQINHMAQQLARLQEAALADERGRALRERIAQVTLAQEEERRRISRELHDGLGPSLAAIGNRLRACRTVLRADPERAEGELDEITQSLKGHIQEIRTLIYDLRPLALDQLGFAGTLKQHVERFGQESGIETSLSVSGDMGLTPLAEVTVLRVIQECLSNVRQHAAASVVEIRLEGRERGVVATVADNGRGFDAGGAGVRAMDNGVGLISMRERADLLGGSLSVQSHPGAGCRVVLHIPAANGERG